MRIKIALATIALFLFVGSPIFGSAKAATRAGNGEVTGCLQSGNGGQYTLTGQNGATWDLKPGEYIDLSPYVGRTVTVAGTEAPSHHMKSANGASHMTVLDVAVDSESRQ
jgi:hypothetical protein